MGICGGKEMAFTWEELDDMEEWTYLTAYEIIELYEKFTSSKGGGGGNGETEPFNPRAKITAEEAIVALGMEKNPLAKRICSVWSTDGSGKLTFHDFIDLVSTFHERAPNHVKAFNAFFIYDFDNDGFLTKPDVVAVLFTMLTPMLKKDIILEIADKIMEEVDIDQSGSLDQEEFAKMCASSQDFVGNFKMDVLKIEGK